MKEYCLSKLCNVLEKVNKVKLSIVCFFAKRENIGIIFLNKYELPLFLK
jgi:hypothetical protein